MIAIEGSLQTRQYQDKNGNNRTATDVLASRVSFCGGKAAEKPTVRDFDQQTENHHVREANAAHSAPQKPQSVSEYSQGSADDFSVIDDSEDLPF
nr:MAG TPA: Single strand binding protein [Caudoviricetes sp.]